MGYAFERHGTTEYAEWYCQIIEKAGSPEWENVRNAILETGLRECEVTTIPRDERKTCFAFAFERKFSKRDIDGAKYLRLNVKGLQRIADWKETASDGYVLKTNKRLKNNLDFGWLDIVIVPYVSEKGREQLEAKSFSGIRFVPAIFDEPEKAAKQLYELTSTQTMPQCLLPIQNNNGDVVGNDDAEGARIWDDAGYVQPILKYRREEVEAMGAFDIAKTREKTGNLPQHYRHQYIVSQAFRQHLEAMKVRSVDFVPVELVDDESEPTVESHT
jgi:hypothetical protein